MRIHLLEPALASGDGSPLVSYGADSLTIVRRSPDDARAGSAPSVAVPGW